MGDRQASIAVIGGWHQSSVVSACFADMGHRVTGICDDPVVTSTLNDGRAPIYEPGLDDLIRRNLAARRLCYTTSYADGLSGTEFSFLCIDTPVDGEDDSDLTPIYAAADQAAAHASDSFVLCVSAQVPIGTCDELSRSIRTRQPRFEIPVVYVPEFLRLGTAIATFREADRFVLGTDDGEIAARVARLYEPLGRPIHVTSRRSAEMAKHASNAFLATSVSFINQIADLCEETGADITEVASIMRLDARIGPRAFLGAGLGYAGGTLGREIRALQHLGQQHRISTGLLDSVAATNEARVPRILQRLKEVNGALAGARVGIFGLAYKPGTSTLRRSAALALIAGLTAEGASVAAFDPLVRPGELDDDVSFELCADPLTTARDAHILVLVAPWNAMSEFDFRACARVMKRAVLFDTGNYLSPAAMAQAGFTYVGPGRGHGSTRGHG